MNKECVNLFLVTDIGSKKKMSLTKTVKRGIILSIKDRSELSLTSECQYYPSGMGRITTSNTNATKATSSVFLSTTISAPPYTKRLTCLCKGTSYKLGGPVLRSLVASTPIIIPLLPLFVKNNLSIIYIIPVKPFRFCVVNKAEGVNA